MSQSQNVREREKDNLMNLPLERDELSTSAQVFRLQFSCAMKGQVSSSRKKYIVRCECERTEVVVLKILSSTKNPENRELLILRREHRSRVASNAPAQ